MIPILYDINEVSFDSNGLGRLRDVISATVVEERNGVYELDFEYPVTGANYDLIQLGRIVGVVTDDTEDFQPFDIVSFSRPIDGVVTFHCVHISYRQSYMTVTGTNINSLADAFDLLATAEPSNPFTYQTDKTSTGYLSSADGVPKSVRSMLGGIEGSILDAYGGEYEWDKFNVILHASRGIDRDFTIRYGVNMLDYNEEMDSSGTYMSCVPYWTDGTNTVVGDRQDGYGSTITGRGECVPLDVSDKFESQPTKAQVESVGLSVMNAKNPGIPSQTIHVEFARLQDLGYSEYENLYQCGLCDTINVVFPYYKTTGKFKIVKTTWNVLEGRYESMELGDLSVTLAEALGISSGSDTAINEPHHTASFYSSSDATLATTDKNAEVSLSKGTSNNGYTLSNNGGVIIPKTGYYLIGGRWNFNTLGNSANTLTCSLRKWNSSDGTTALDAYGITHTGAYFAWSSAPVLYQLNQNEVVFVSARNNTSATGKFGGGLTIEFMGV